MMNKFESWLRSEGLAETTSRMYAYLLHRLSEISGPPEEWTGDSLCRGLALLYKDRNIEQGKSLSLIALRKYYRYLIYTGIAFEDASAGLRVRRHRSRNLPVATLLSLKELELLENRDERYSQLSLRNKVILGFLRENALTSQEIGTIRHKDIDLSQATLKVRPGLKLNGRKFLLTGVQVYQIGEYLKEHPPGSVDESVDWFFKTPNGAAITPGLVSYMLEQFKSRVPAKNINPMRVRQSVIYHWLNSDKIPLERVQIMAGHRDICSTLKYLAPYTDEELAAVNVYHPINDWGTHPLLG